MILVAIALIVGAVAGFLLRDLAGCAACDEPALRAELEREEAL